LGDTRIRVLPRDIQLHPFRPKLLSLNWLAYVPGRYPGIKLDLPLKAINAERCPGYKEGGWLLELMYKLPVWVRGDVVPPYLAMDLRGKRLGDKIMASELNLGEGVQLRWSHGHDFAVAKLVGSRRGLEEEAAAAAPAAGEKAAAGEKGAKPAGGAAPAAAEKAAPAKK
jgi:large subunit ribosomal protein L25